MNRFFRYMQTKRLALLSCWLVRQLPSQQPLKQTINTSRARPPPSCN